MGKMRSEPDAEHRLRRELANLQRRIDNHYPPNDIMGITRLERHQKALEVEIANLLHHATMEKAE